jgi:hypothetical protein
VTGDPGAPFEVRWAAPARRALRRLPEKVEVLAIGHRADIYRRG